MSKRFLVFIALFLFFMSISFSQSLTDTVFNNVIRIGNENVWKISNSYIIDLPICTESNMIYNESIIPFKFIVDNWGDKKCSRYFVISPEKKAKNELKENIEDADNASIIINKTERFLKKKDTIYRDDNGFVVSKTNYSLCNKDDSIFITAPKPPKINFKSFDSSKYQCAYFLTSTGCDMFTGVEDSRRYEMIRRLINCYQAETNVNLLHGILIHVTGMEGESEQFITLEGLTLSQKLNFLMDLNQILNPLDETICDKQQIFVPHLVPKEKTPYWEIGR